MTFRIHPQHRSLTSLSNIAKQASRSCNTLRQTSASFSITVSAKTRPIGPLISLTRHHQKQLFTTYNTTTRMASQFTTLRDGRSLEYLLSGPSDAPVVLLANSLCAPFTSWDNIVPLIHAKGLRTLNYNQPGHGASSAPKNLDTTFPSMADDANDLLKSLSITSLHAWIGVSMGAAASFYFVSQYPGVVRKLIVCDTISSSPRNAGADDLFGPRVAAARQAGNLQTTTEQTLQRWFGDAWIAANPAEADRMRSLMLRTTLDGFETCCHALRSDTFDIRPLFRKAGAGADEALLVVGEKDANLPQTMATMRDEVQKGFEEAGKSVKVELRVLKNAGHVCYVDGFEQFRDDVLSFL